MNLLLLLLFLVTTNKIDAQVSKLCDIDSISHNYEEVLTYKIYYNWGFLWIPAGEVTFKTIVNDNYYEFEASGKTYSAYDPIFKVRDYFYSKVDRETLRPFEFNREVSEGNYTQYYSTQFDFTDNTAYTTKGKTINSTESKQITLPNNCVQDMLSLLYRLRKIDVLNVNKGDEMSLDLFLDNKIYPIDLRFGKSVKRKSIKNLGKHNVRKLEANLIAGDVFNEEDKMTLWISNDHNSIPLQIESPISVGSIRAVLKSHTGLKYNLGE